MEDNELVKNNIIAEFLERISAAHNPQRELMTVLEEFVNGDDGYLAMVALRAAYYLDPISGVKIIANRLRNETLRRGEAKQIAALLGQIDIDFVKKDKK